MGKGRAPCCDKTQVKRGPWSPEEDIRLITFIQKHGHDNWRALPKQAGLLRCGKSCRLRWINYLRPDVKRGNFTEEEERTLIKLHETFGNKWSKIASHLPGRTDNEIKNVWNTHLKKRLASKEASAQGDELSSITSSSSSSSSSFTSCGNAKQNTGVGIVCHSETGPILEEKPHEAFDLTHLDKVEDSKEEATNQLGPAKYPREQTSSSGSSYGSNISNTSPGDHVSWEEVRMDSLFDYGGPYDISNILEEVNKPDILDKLLEIPLEADVDFWNMLDNLEFTVSNEIQNRETKACQSSTFGEENSKEVEDKKWLRYLENELGLDAMGEENWEILTNDATEPPAPGHLRSVS